ncbi:sigma-70 family RNA polymerase sigma factor [Henriciella marina]|uniref:sigma-70 family RNA polymerase sigma factor n=1 Tax=Henriciella marina TaxID=453851 RepID=UPI001F31F332|nr:sigma-70 family RNA polymerase sigma factor [Henriciella marina]
MSVARIDQVQDARALHADCMRRISDFGDRRAFGILFEFFGPRLKTYLMRMGARDAQAEEIVQDVMLTVWRKAGQFDPDQASVSTWIFRIARNRQIDLFRRSSKPELSPDEPMLQPAPEQAPFDTLSQAQLEAHVRDKLTVLPAEQLELLKAAFYDGMSHAEIAAEFNLPLGTVKSRIRLAFDKLRGVIRRE